MSRLVDLAKYTSPGIRVFAGRARGEAVREDARLAAADRTGESVRIRVPDDVFSVNSSFFLGMFGDSIRYLGEVEFRRRYSFEGGEIGLVLEDAIREALRTTSPLRPTLRSSRRSQR